MLMPSTNVLNSFWGENLFEDWPGFPFERELFGGNHPLFGKNASHGMKTDVREKEDGYEVMIDLPGYAKDEINAKLDNGYLTISASKDSNKEEKDENGRLIRQERYIGSMSRSFYVGDAVTQEDIKARYENGILQLSIPKKDPKKVEENHFIAIEG
ncbi:MAG: Hsp20/alpha crystallin family protein [Clostridium sp.]|nr:Hsp20/alpha crystallin family protein [Acetatifactor muris]MCM1527504.1 Hsp20/alpha crystallin family protein [Bacteroides sp.]MCM1563746.1 Hsp20/alpha crystallin family protein [Clostridium sp.]